MAAANNNNNNLVLHRIFTNRHGFTDPPLNPKVVVDVSFCNAAADRGGTAVTFVTGLLGNARFYTTKCISEKIPADARPEHLKIIYCLHSSKDDNPVACLKLILRSVNPKEYFLATVDNLQLANHVNALPIITLSGIQHVAAVFRPPSASQILYADSHTDAEILERKSEDLKALKNKKKNSRKKSRLHGSR